MIFELQPVLQGELLTLRPLVAADFERLFEVASNPKIWEQHPEPDRYKRDVFQKFFQKAIDSKGAFLITDRKTGAAVGSSRFYRLDDNNDQIVIGYTFLAPQCWGHTYNKELKALMIDHAFKFVSRVIFKIWEHNTRSQKAIEKIGAQFLERSTSQSHDGKTFGELAYYIDRGAAQ